MVEGYAIPSTQVTGLILAGGQGRRMGGRNKGLIEVDGRVLADYAADNLKPHVQQLLVCSNNQHPCYRKLGYTVIDDGEFAGLGPLAGILAGLRAIHTPWLAIAACDQLSLPARVYATLIQTAAQNPVGMALASGHPTCAVVHQRVAPSLEQRLLAGDLRLARWFQEMGATDVVFPNVTFANINTPQDLNRAK